MPNHPNRSRTNRRMSANPRPTEIVRARELAGLTQEQAGELVHSPLKSWQKWEATTGDDQRRMHPSTWELFNIKLNARRLLEAREISPELLQALGIHLPRD